MPMRPKTKPMRALSDARRKSIASVMVAPMPTAAPLIAAITGLVQLKIDSVTRPPVSRTPLWIAGSSRRSCISLSVGRWVSSRPKTLPPTDKSMPAQKARPAPVTTTARTVSSALAPLNAASSSFAISTVNAFILSGRLSVSVRIPSGETTQSRVLNFMSMLQKNAPRPSVPGAARLCHAIMPHSYATHLRRMARWLCGAQASSV